MSLYRQANKLWRNLPSAFDQAEVAQKISTLNTTNMSIELNIHKRIEPEKNGKTPVLIQHLENKVIDEVGRG